VTNNPTLQRFIRVFGIALFLVLWQIIGLTKVINPVVFPTPIQVFKALADYFHSGELMSDLLASLGRMCVGFLIGSTLGIIIGMLTGRSKTINLLLAPLLNFFRALPPVAILPLFIIWFGIDDWSKMLTISFGCFFQVWLNTNTGASRIPSSVIWNSYLLTRSKFKRILKVEIPATLPFIVAGLRLSIATALIMVFVSELAGSNNGIGYTISNAQMSYRIDLMIAALIILAGVSVIIDYAIQKAAVLLFPWLKANVN